MAGASGKKLYKLVWLRGLKTTRYLRTMSATSVEKSPVAHGALNLVPSGESGAGGGSGAGFGTGGGVGGVSAAGGFNAAAVDAAAPEADGPVCMTRPRRSRVR
jgi:ribonucleoside-diphosphate reductase alpha chain